MLTHADGKQGWVDHNKRSSRIGARRGFTLVELTITLGMVMILLGLLAPAVGRSMESARMTRDLAQLQQCMTLVGLYAADYRDIFPVADSNPFRAGESWHSALQAAGYVKSPAEVDPAAFRRFGRVTFYLSVCLAYSPERMLPGQTLPAMKAVSRAVYQHSVPYPSGKGAMLKGNSGEGTVTEGAHWWCCVDRWCAPVAMCDGSAMLADYLAMNHGRAPVVVDQVGIPVWSTWGGYLGRDR
jgi:type II secretory pathway pseudopilin PulG